MNRAFIYILIPGVLVGVVHATMRWGVQVALPLGILVSVAVAAGYAAISRREAKSRRGGIAPPG